MTKKISIGKALWYCVVCFITFIFLGSFIVSRNFVDLIYLVMLYISLLVGHIIK